MCIMGVGDVLILNLPRDMKTKVFFQWSIMLNKDSSHSPPSSSKYSHENTNNTPKWEHDRNVGVWECLYALKVCV